MIKRHVELYIQFFNEGGLYSNFYDQRLDKILRIIINIIENFATIQVQWSNEITFGIRNKEQKMESLILEYRFPIFISVTFLTILFNSILDFQSTSAFEKPLRLLQDEHSQK